MSKHTPGPWVIYPETDGSEINAVDMKPGLPIRQPIAQVCRYGEWIANARLIAAAPELLEALEYYAETFCEAGIDGNGCGKFTDDVCSGCRARAAIAKAKGEA